MNDIKSKLIEARDLIEKNGWCQGGAAKDKDGNYCSPYKDKAVEFCAIGAIAHVAGITPFGVLNVAYAEMRQALQDALGPMFIAAWNDRPERTKEEVLKLFDKAIKTRSRGRF